MKFDCEKLFKIYEQCGFNCEKIRETTGIKGVCLDLRTCHLPELSTDTAFSNILDVKFISRSGQKRRRYIHIGILRNGEICVKLGNMRCDKEDFIELMKLYNNFLEEYKDFLIFE